MCITHPSQGAGSTLPFLLRSTKSAVSLLSRQWLCGIHGHVNCHAAQGLYGIEQVVVYAVNKPHPSPVGRSIGAPTGCILLSHRSLELVAAFTHAWVHAWVHDFVGRGGTLFPAK